MQERRRRAATRGVMVQEPEMREGDRQGGGSIQCGRKKLLRECSVITGAYS